MKFLAAKAYILNQLDTNLDDTLYYHGKHHTLDVYEVVIKLCEAAQLSDYNTLLLSTAALFHDTGFMRSYRNHEWHSCNITRETLPKFDYTEGEIEQICQMIMATKIPQLPQNIYEEIICDADLDYLGRSDFYTIGQTLFEELKAHKILSTDLEWNILQVQFIESHQYFTHKSQTTREARKQEYLSELKALLKTKK